MCAVGLIVPRGRSMTILNISSGILNILSVFEALLKLPYVKFEPPAHLLQWILKMKNGGF